MINYERLRQGIEDTTLIPIDTERLLSSATEEGEFIKTSIKGMVTMIFNKEYECVECYGETITEQPPKVECEEL